MFSSTVMDHFHNPRRVGTLMPHTGLGLAGSMEEGRFVQITVRLEEGRIAAARFKTYGCVPAIAAGDCLAEWVEGMTMDEARTLTPQDLIARLGGLPPQRQFCAALAIQALRNALEAALESVREGSVTP